MQIRFAKTFKETLEQKVEKWENYISELHEDLAIELYDIIARGIEQYKQKNWFTRWLDAVLSGKQLRNSWGGECVTLVELRQWLATSEFAIEFIKKYSLTRQFYSRWYLLQSVKENKDYYRAVLLLKYCRGLKEVNVPVSFIQWFEEK